MPPEARASRREANLAIREASPAQYAEIGELTVRAYATVGDPLQGGPTYAAYEDELRDVAGRAETCHVLVAVDDAGRILGAVTYVPGPGTPWSESEREREAGFRALAVDPAARGNGVGRALAMACVDRARAMGRHGVAIYTRPSMSVAHALYESLGFARVPSRDWEFEPGEWLWSYVLSL
ncbi:MAG: GNAT family N-acetyltransferase [Candidatus Limnocylindrales bacterium]